jgi:dihydroorotate dehydrogenase electron transfer subunit
MIKQKEYEVVENIEVANGYYKLTIFAPELAQAAKPGQFVNIRVSKSLTPLLRKPFGIYAVDAEKISILYRLVGKGTQILSEVEKDQMLDVLGPLGTPAKISKDTKKTAIIAGGVGIAAVRLITENIEGDCDLFYGVQNKSELAELNIWEELTENIFLSSDDGSCGEKGFITEVFAANASKYERVICCGPKVMMEKVFNACSDSIETYFLMEEYMACGIGICMGCVTKTKKGYRCICKDGPVFKGSDIVW